MDVVALGWRTDLGLLRLGGTTVTDRGDHLVVRTADNPTFRWGNHLLIDRSADLADPDRWVAAFRAEFPDADYVTIGVDGVAGTVDDLASFAAAGFTTDASTVMTATAVHPPGRPNLEATYRPLTSDDDWGQSLDLRIACADTSESPEGFLEFARARGRTQRRLVDAGHGVWFGAFLGARLACQMGLLSVGDGLARYQEVETHPDLRGRGLAGSLVHAVARHGLDQMRARTLVMVADPDYLAIRIYRAVGFEGTETQLQAERRPGQAGPA